MGGRKTVGKIIGESITFFKRNFRLFFITSSFVYGSTYLFMLLFVDNVSGFIFDGIDSLTDHDIIDTLIGFSSLLYLVYVCLLLLATAFITRLLSLPADMLYINASDAMLQLSQGQKPTIKLIAVHFKRNWKRYLGISAWVSLWTWLWSLVFFIPGIVKSYSYMLAPYLILEYPDMTVRQALRKSKEITLGYKGRLFGLELLLGIPYAFLIDLPNRIFDIATQFPTYYFYSDMAFSILALLVLEPIGYIMFVTAYLDIKQAAIEKGLLPPNLVAAALNQEGVCLLNQTQP